MAVTTKNVVGSVNNLSDGDITGMTMLFDLDPPWVAIDDAVIVGVQAGGVKGEPITPGSDGTFSVDLVAVDDATWTITVTISGPTVETPIVISIAPPPATGSGDVNFTDLIVPASTPGTPVIVVNPGAGAVNSVNGHTGTVNLTYADVGALASSYTPTFPVTSVNTKTGAAVLTAADVGALTQTAADSRYIQDADGSKALVIVAAQLFVYRNETAGTYAGRTTVTASTTRPVWWVGSVAPLIGSGFAIDNLDFWVKTP